MAEEPIEVGLVIRDTQFKSAIANANKQTEDFKKKAKDSGNAAAGGFDKATGSLIKMGLAFFGLQSVGKIISGITQNSEILASVHARIAENLGGLGDSIAEFFDLYSRDQARARAEADRLSRAWVANAKALAEIQKVRASLTALDLPAKAFLNATEMLDSAEKTLQLKVQLQELQRVLNITGESSAALDALMKALQKTMDDQKASVEEAAKAEQKLVDAMTKARKELNTVAAIDPDELYKKLLAFEHSGEVGDFSDALQQLGFNVLDLRKAMDEAKVDAQLAAFSTQLKANAEELGLTEGAIDSIVSRIKEARSELASQNAKAEEDIRKALEESKKYTAEGFKQGFSDAVNEMYDLERVGADVARGISQSFSDFLFSSMRDGIANIKDLLGSLRDLGLRTFSNLLSGQLTGGLGSLLGLSIPARARGGDVEAGRPYQVGEQGAELFVPKTSGTIVPNHALRGGGGRSVTQNFHFHTMDPATLMDFVRRNKGVFSAVFREMLAGGDMGLRDAVRTA